MTLNGPQSGSWLSRRQFTLGLAAAGGSALLGRAAPAATIELRQFHNQPAESPLHTQSGEPVGGREAGNRRPHRGQNIPGKRWTPRRRLQSR